MRIWSIHPAQLDRQALIACWRETLLAQAVLAGRTKGYTKHPQLERFRETSDPSGAVGEYLWHIAEEATARGYKFDRTRIDQRDESTAMTVTEGQLDFEWGHLLRKSAQRSAEHHAQLITDSPRCHPIFSLTEGPIASWERP